MEVAGHAPVEGETNEMRKRVKEAVKKLKKSTKLKKTRPLTAFAVRKDSKDQQVY